ncbi:PREDICTED: putative Dol-P-Glc:Glc(2)Man(9)GlcNAc(2)-PP-Dol alpha-1,2-glucosyltransferase [Gekko japonicus]|uniref:Dol-P-Glc:Glc(2)Man(9)GlcNAc(2)-PP-Dol alpha-1,2-glucosyltransferase n=1 Tax=Gekko japonicus TaxID=146911 RepID=A0ABM1KAV6_GEKJA|nr:PREDICTED: putative Dol-P-Glc:Glc(2)Man(9)GlcNAc(2)-PP-Dol alpha-1,2-glucosyltransferase [Gekko japonicus]
MERSEAYFFSAAFSCAFLVSCLLFSALNLQRAPYMDEAFHIPQAQAYCEGRFTQWDPMITTLPGLYLVSVGVVKPAAWLFGWSGSIICSTGMLRFINLLFSVGNFYLLYLLFSRIHQKKAVSGFQRIVSTLTLTIFPVLYFFTFLYYTDTGSTFFTLFAYLMCLYGNHKTSALLGFCGFMFRQTNIIWTVFCGGSVVADKLSEAWKVELLKRKEQKSLPPKGSFSELISIFRFLLEYVTSLKNITTLILLTWPYIGMVVVFFAFIFINGGIVVGDRSSHEACLHFPQIFYFFSFTLFFSFPYLMTPSKIISFLHSVKRHLLQYSILAIISLFLVWKFTYVHKYLLADNRHYPFYIWRKLYQRHELVKYVLVPVYIFAGWSFTDMLTSKNVFWKMVYFVCLLTATVPQKLLEFRYFILPYVMYKLHIPMPSLLKLLLELAFYLLINAVTFHFFLNKTFQWQNNEELQRFMW